MRTTFRRLLAMAVLVPAAVLVAPVASTPAHADSTSMGVWSAPFDIGGVAVHATLAHTGDVLFFQYYEGQRANGDTSLVRTWNYLTGAQADAPFGYPRDVFCAGHVVLPDGRVFISGGHDHTTVKGSGVGINNADVYDPVTRRWTPAPPLGQARWYPTDVALPNGTALTFGGQARKGVPSSTVESYDPVANTMTTLPTTASKNLSNYPRLHLMTDGTILKTGTASMAASFHPSTNRWTNVASMNFGARFRSASVLLPGLHQVMMIGGATTEASAATNTVEILDTSQTVPTWRYTTPMNYRRVNANAVTLPDGKVLVIGGGSSGAYTGPVTAAEMFDPTTQTWTVMASQLAGRSYHSTAMLLPDGRVLSAGQDHGAYATTAEIYSPPYLFNGTRPTTAAAPDNATYGQSLTIETPEAADITKVTLIRASSVTHEIDTDQRYVSLGFTTSNSTVTASSPSNANIAPPGYYMLFLVNSSGVPSVASWVRIG